MNRGSGRWRLDVTFGSPAASRVQRLRVGRAEQIGQRPERVRKLLLGRLSIAGRQPVEGGVHRAQERVGVLEPARLPRDLQRFLRQAVGFLDLVSERPVVG